MRRLALTDRTHFRALATAATLAAGLVLSACNGDSISPSAKANRPIPDKLLAEIEAKNMDKGSPILVRLFKQEAELEVWKQDRSGKFALLKTYPICRWSGDLGPKVKEGDRQAPEGFYSITPAQMNPQSAYYLSFNTGFPNAYDKAWGRTGSQLMVHGDCSSRGCYAMTDEQISEIYALGRESFFGGQNAFQFQAYPFRMTAENMARHRNNPNMPFWRMIKEGNDHFEITRQEPKVDFCEKKYVFDAAPPEGAAKPLAFNASAKCPAYQIPADLAEAVREKERQDDQKIAQLVSRGTPLAHSRAGIDGGMHPVFASKLPDGEAAIDKDVTDYTVASYGPAPGTIPSYATLPLPQEPAPAVASANSEPVVAVTAATPAASTGGSSGPSLLSRLTRSIGLGGHPDSDTTPSATKAATSSVPKAKSSDAKVAARPTSPRVVPLDRERSAQAQTAAPQPQGKSAFPEPAPTATSSQNASPTLAGAQPTVSTNSFDSRWATIR